MSGVVIAGLMLVLMFAGILVGVHVGFTLLGISLLGMWLIVGDFGKAASLLGTGPFYAVFEYEYSVIPLFVLMGLLASISGASDDLYRGFNVFLGRVRGGLAIATVLSNAVFAAITGVSLASAAVFSKIAIPQMLRFGYDKRFALGTVAGSSVLGMLIPPSVLLIVYGILAEQAIGRLFMAGFIPGLVMTAIYTLGVAVMVRARPHLVAKPAAIEGVGCQTQFRGVAGTWPVFALIGLVLGGIYGGLFTPTEAGAVGAIGTLILALAKRKLGFANLRGALLETGLVAASFFLLFIAAQMFGRMLATSGFVRAFSEAILSLPVPPIMIIALMLFVFLVMGCFLDSISIMVITLPLFLPVVNVLGFDLIWFGIVATVAIETGMITPPFGMVVFVMKATIGEGVTVQDIFIGSAPFLLMMFASLAVLVPLTFLSTWLPSLM